MTQIFSKFHSRINGPEDLESSIKFENVSILSIVTLFGFSINGWQPFGQTTEEPEPGNLKQSVPDTFETAMPATCEQTASVPTEHPSLGTTESPVLGSNGPLLPDTTEQKDSLEPG